MTEVRELATGLRFPEGPVLLDDGSVVVVEIARGAITRVAPDGAVSLVADGLPGPNGAALAPDGSLVVCDNGGRFDWLDIMGLTVPAPLTSSGWSGGSLRRVDLDTGEVTTLYTECDGRPLLAPNDLVLDGHGGVWFTDHGHQRERTTDRTGVFHAALDGSSIREVIHPLDAPNGIGLSPAGDRLYVAETHHGRLLAWDVTGPGEVASTDGLNSGGEVLAHPGHGRLFDSLAVHPDGSIVIGTLGDGGLTVVRPDGSGSDHVPLPDPLVTNVCFSADGGTAVVTLSGTGVLAAIDWPPSG